MSHWTHAVGLGHYKKLFESCVWDSSSKCFVWSISVCWVWGRGSPFCLWEISGKSTAGKDSCCEARRLLNNLYKPVHELREGFAVEHGGALSAGFSTPRTTRVVPATCEAPGRRCGASRPVAFPRCPRPPAPCLPLNVTRDQPSTVLGRWLFGHVANPSQDRWHRALY